MTTPAMSPRERLTAAARGGQPDQKPTIALGPRTSNGPIPDAIVVPPGQVAQTLAQNPEAAVLAHILSPLARARRQSIDILTLLKSEPEAGDQHAETLALETSAEAAEALAQGADGILYDLDGAYPAASSPMQYGGHFLEKDRSILEAVQEARLNVVFVRGTAEPYIDFVSDLPAHVFAWQAESGVTPAMVRELRTGALAANHPDADIALLYPATGGDD